MKIKVLAAVLLSTFAISTAYAADEAMPAGDMTQSATTQAASATDKATDASATAKKHTKKHKPQ